MQQCMAPCLDVPENLKAIWVNSTERKVVSMGQILISQKAKTAVQKHLADHKAKLASDPLYSKEYNERMKRCMENLNRIAEKRKRAYEMGEKVLEVYWNQLTTV
jgi:hypothetical protein